jgi:hypothetical protein
MSEKEEEKGILLHGMLARFFTVIFNKRFVRSSASVWCDLQQAFCAIFSKRVVRSSARVRSNLPDINSILERRPICLNTNKHRTPAGA